MNVSASSGHSALWQMLAQRAQASSSSRSLASATETTSLSSSATTASRPSGPPPGPPPSPGQFDLGGMSTAQFAGQGGSAPQDPIASLDADGNGSVSGSEFGLDSASSDVKALFGAIDSDGSGDLSSSEIDAFREAMTQADGSGSSSHNAGAHGHHGPPPGPPPEDASNQGSQSQGSTQAQALDVSAFIQQLAQRYASLASGNAGASSGSSVNALA